MYGVVRRNGCRRHGRKAQGGEPKVYPGPISCLAERIRLTISANDYKQFTGEHNAEAIYQALS